MKQLVEYIRSYREALLRTMGVQIAEYPRHESARGGGRPLRTERRRETRSPISSPCIYGLTRLVDRDGVIFEEGHGTTVNDSVTGIRLLLGIAPAKEQLLEIQTTHATFRRAVYLAEVCWTKPLREEAQGVLYLVGCRLKFITAYSEVI